MITSAFQSVFNAWLDDALGQAIPPNVVAFSFNLAEPWCIDIVGSDRFSADDSDWACEETFRPDIEDLDLPESDFGSTWQAVFEDAKRMVSAYLDRPSAGSAVLQRADAVTVGFVDGELHKVWPK